MSVRGEFVRIVGDAIQALERTDADAASDLAAELGKARETAGEDLSAAATRVLEALDGAAERQLHHALGEAGERLVAIARIVLGR